ncbi:UPF0149 family protein [Pasteurellaceae bacterium HPA106]|uniref:UPF0149 family protein n=1 Tax=Spirabiliibacterium pneumoniae TaxID=221400 RepID=UPI001AACF38E|nr:UPF0149 family protein [Spirabiliibacterium pneumoniae]MBE2895795.1 UPF0149 family protein [Spirabiliibacterium pneumoniae]
MLTDKDYLSLEQQLNRHKLDVNPAELHGFLTGLACGNMQNRMEPLLLQMYGNGKTMPSFVMDAVKRMQTEIHAQLALQSPEAFRLYLDSRSPFAYAHSAFRWAATFILGLGFAQHDLEKHGADVQSALKDLLQIAATEIVPEEDDPQEVQEIMDNTVKYMQELVVFFYNFYHPDNTNRVVH